MTYEHLLLKAEMDSVEVYEKKLQSTIKGLYSDHVIWINKNQSLVEKSCILAEELGHHYTTSGDILNQKRLINRKQEKRARNWAYKRLVPLRKVIEAQKKGIRNRFELADFLGVTEEFLENAISRYKEEYGLFVEVNEFTICLEPLGVVEWFEDSF